VLANRTIRKRKKANRLSDMTVDEISVVTRPANQHATIVFSKSDDGVYRLPDGRIDYGAELLEHGPGRLTELGEMLGKTEQRKPKFASAVSADAKSPRRLLTDDDGWDWAKADLFGEEALFLEANVLDEVEKRGVVIQATDSNLTREQAIAKVLRDNPDFLKVNRAAQIAKARASALPTGRTIAKARQAQDDRLLDVLDQMADQESALSLLRAEAEQMVREGRAATVEQAIVQLLKEHPELRQAWNAEFREP
jgi:hypothetical protein